MTFSRFAKIMFQTIGGEYTASEFVIFLTSQIMEDPQTDSDKALDVETEYNPMAKLDSSLLRKILAGTQNMSKKTARKIVPHLDKAKFSEYLDSLSLDALEHVGSLLREEGVEVINNVSETCANLFAEILYDCAGIQDGQNNQKKPKLLIDRPPFNLYAEQLRRESRTLEGLYPKEYIDAVANYKSLEFIDPLTED